MNRKVKIALAKTGLSLQDIADKIGRSKVLVSMILSNKHKGHEHVPKIARMLSIKEKDVTNGKN